MRQVLINEGCKERPNAQALGAYSAAVGTGYKQGLKMKLNKDITMGKAKDVYSDSIGKAKEITNTIREGKKTETNWTEKDTKSYEKIRSGYLRTAGNAKAVIKKLK